MATARRVKGNGTAEGRCVQAQGEESSGRRGVLKRNRITGECVGHDASGEREHVADNAHQHDREQTKHNAPGVASQIGHQTTQALVGS